MKMLKKIVKKNNYNKKNDDTQRLYDKDFEEPQQEEIRVEINKILKMIVMFIMLMIGEEQKIMMKINL